MTDNILKKHVERTYPPPVRAPAGPTTGGAKELVAEVYPADKTYRVSRRGQSCLTSPVVADDGRTRVFVAFRDAERFVSDGAGTARRAKRGGRGAVTGETATEIQRTVS